MNDTPENPQEQSKFSSQTFRDNRKQPSRTPIVISGMLIAALAVGIGYEIVRAKGPDISQAEKQRHEIGRTDVMAQPAVRVNNQVITREELARECLEQFGSQVLESVVNRAIIQQACAEKGIEVTDSEVTGEVNRISKKVGLPTDQWYKMVLGERKMTPLQYHRDVIWPLLALRKLAGKKVVVTPEMFEEAYVDNYGPRVRAKMIILDNVRRGSELVEKLKQNPDSFEDLARDYSVEQNSRALGGSIPPIRRYSGAHEEIRKAAFRMKEPGQISPLLQIGIKQYAILKYEGRTEPVEHDPKDVKQELFDELHEREVQVLVGDTFQQLKQQARVDNYLTGETTSPIRKTSATTDDKFNSSF